MAALSSSIGRFRALKGWLPSRRPAGYPSRISRESFVVASIFLVLGTRGGLGMRSGGLRRTDPYVRNTSMLHRIAWRVVLPAALSATLFSFPASGQSQDQQTPSVAEAARRAREQKKKSEKSARVISDDTLKLAPTAAAAPSAPASAPAPSPELAPQSQAATAPAAPPAAGAPAVPATPAAEATPNEKKESADNAAEAASMKNQLEELEVAGIVRTVLNVPVPWATVHVVHLASGRAWVSWTDRDGKFSYPGLPAGRYRLEAKQLGFRTGQPETEFAVGTAVEAQLTLHVDLSSTTPADTKSAEAQPVPANAPTAPESAKPAEESTSVVSKKSAETTTSAENVQPRSSPSKR